MEGSRDKLPSAMGYTLEYAGIPFVLDVARVVRLHQQAASEQEAPEQLPPRKYQPEVDLLDELDRLLPSIYRQDFANAPVYPGRNVGALAREERGINQPLANNLRIGDWYYPPTASRWSVFRGLATSSQVKSMLAVTGGYRPAAFVMKANPIAPNHPDSDEASYTLTSPLYMLPPRPIAEHGGTFDGLYLVTLIDERYYWPNSSSILHCSRATTWFNLLEQMQQILGITILYNGLALTASSIPAVYGQPEIDSQLWVNGESASTLLDAIAYNIGTVFVRNLNATYNLLTPLTSKSIVETNRGNADKVWRVAGGDIFTSGTKLPVGSLTNARSYVVPAVVNVAFPKYVKDDDPVPHFVNPRYQNQRPSAWYEESYGDCYVNAVPILSGGTITQGLIGVGGQVLHTTAKALYSGDVYAASGMPPINKSGLDSLAIRIAKDYYESQLAFALDEVYPGTYNWTPEGIHDVIWTYSARTKCGTTRVMRGEWNQIVTDFQHSHFPLTGFTHVPKGVGGTSVAQSWIDGSSGLSVSGSLSQTLLSGAFVAVVSDVKNWPTQNRWRGQIDDEIIFFEGTSGGDLRTRFWTGFPLQRPHCLSGN